MSKILLTGFEPFAGETINPSLEVVKRLEEETWGNIEINLVQLPVVFGESVERVKAAIAEFEPDIVIAIGQAGGRSAISIERVAINIDDASITDNAGNQPIDQTIRSESPAAYFSTLPIKKMMKAGQDAGVPTIISNSAGTYVCNHLMYGILDILTGSNKLGGFIHIPYLPEQVVSKPNQPSMSLEMLLKGFKAIIAAVDESWHKQGGKDEKLIGGALD